MALIRAPSSPRSSSSTAAATPARVMPASNAAVPIPLCVLLVRDPLLTMPRLPCPRAGGALLLELNRVLRPGGFFVWSATPVYQKLTEDVEIWKGT